MYFGYKIRRKQQMEWNQNLLIYNEHTQINMYSVTLKCNYISHDFG